MKKILFLLIALLSFGSIGAQTTQPSGTLTITGATLNDADTAYATSPAIYGKGSLAMSITVTKTSGTATGSAFLFVSNDGVNWEQWSTTDSMNLASPILYDGVTQKTYTFKVPITYWLYYEARLIQGGTAVNVASGDYKYCKDNGYR